MSNAMSSRKLEERMELLADHVLNNRRASCSLHVSL
jgi:hypothetical protein